MLKEKDFKSWILKEYTFLKRPVFIIDKENSQLMTLPKGAKESQLLEGLQANLQQVNAANQTEQENFQDFVSLAHQGYQHILEPITSRLPADVKELIIVPDAALNYLPFEALLSKTLACIKAFKPAIACKGW